MKLGVIAEPDRSPDSPDTVVVVEPTIGAIARSKGHLYLVVSSTIASARAQEATQLAAETIRGRRRRSSLPRRSGASTTTTNRPGSASASRRRSGRRTSA
jgi:hypothetical protein